MENYKPNSHKSKEEHTSEEKRVEKVVSGSVKSKKRNEVRKFADVFFPEDKETIMTHIIMDIVIPATKKAILNAVEIILNGETGYSKSKSSASRVSYRDYYDRGDERRSRNEVRVRNNFDYDDIVIETRGDAELVLDQLDDLIDRYGFARVLDLYDAVELTPPYTSNKYGWTNLSTAKIVAVRDGFVLKLPRALPLD